MFFSQISISTGSQGCPKTDWVATRVKRHVTSCPWISQAPGFFLHPCLTSTSDRWTSELHNTSMYWMYTTIRISDRNHGIRNQLMPPRFLSTPPSALVRSAVNGLGPWNFCSIWRSQVPEDRAHFYMEPFYSRGNDENSLLGGILFIESPSIWCYWHIY